LVGLPKRETVSLFQGRLRYEEGRLGIRALRAVTAPSRENAREVLSVGFHDDFFTVRVRIQVGPPDFAQQNLVASFYLPLPCSGVPLSFTFWIGNQKHWVSRERSSAFSL